MKLKYDAQQKSILNLCSKKKIPYYNDKISKNTNDQRKVAFSKVFLNDYSKYNPKLYFLNQFYTLWTNGTTTNNVSS